LHQLQREDEDLFQKVKVPSMRPRCMAHIGTLGISIVVTVFIPSFGMAGVLFDSAKSKIRMFTAYFHANTKTTILYFLIFEGLHIPLSN